LAVEVIVLRILFTFVTLFLISKNKNFLLNNYRLNHHFFVLDSDLIRVDFVEGADLPKKFTENDILLDVRKKNEIDQGMFEGSQWIELINLEKEHMKLSKDKKLFVLCATGNRSLIGISILKNLGFEKIVNVAGGFTKAKECGMKIIKPEQL
jgi:rhodanese-related sulfurtransferase